MTNPIEPEPKPPTESAPAPVRGRVRKQILLGALPLFLGVGLLLVAARLTPLPGRLGQPQEASLRVLDRDGKLLVELGRHGERRQVVRLEETSPCVVESLLAAEDSRFYLHPGFDPLAMGRAVFEGLRARRIVSGASTITQQLARAHFERPRTLRGKLIELYYALVIEAHLDKRAILEAYLNDVVFTPKTRGLQAASQALLDKSLASLDCAEAAMLVGLARGPSLYDPAKRVALARKRRDRILERMLDGGSLDQESFLRAKSEPVVLHKAFRSGRAEHFARALLTERFGSVHPERGEILTSLDEKLQAEAESLVLDTQGSLSEFDASAAAAVVLDNDTREILAYVGSPDFWNEAILGQNDGVLARRQPGSTLKPFVYAAAFSELGYTPATLVPDIELRVPTENGVYSPKNYDGQFHGPVRVRSALANSLNVPAVHTLLQLGPERLLTLLHGLGFASLDQSSTHYGAALALGDGEVSLLELANAYATLARGGGFSPTRVERLRDPSGGSETSPRTALPAEAAALVTSMLSDDSARESAFGQDSVLDLPFPAAVKTGTSKGYRDNFTVGYTSEVTVAVWVGNFNGHPMKGISGVSGAGPLFRKLMLAAMRDRDEEPLVSASGFVQARICPLSGRLAGPHCEHSMLESFPRGHAPSEVCPMHQEIFVSERGMLADESCTVPKRRVTVENYPSEFLAWARSASRPLPPEPDPRCPAARSLSSTGSSRPRILNPLAGAQFTIDPSLPLEKQALHFRVDGPRPLRLEVDGRTFPVHDGGARVPLVRGDHRATLRAPDGNETSLTFSVH